MPSGRGVVVFAAGLGLWLAARLAGSPTLHMVAVGLVVLPFAAAVFARWSRQRLRVRRRLAESRVAPGQRVTVELEVENHSLATSSLLLLEDRLPSALGRSARLVLAGLPPRAKQRVSYSLIAQSRGHYTLGPLSVDLSDPFALTRMRVEFEERDQLIVTPEVEPLEGGADSPFGASSGLSLSRRLFRTGQEFYTMRQYQQGDDLRRIHWPSVARSGELMIRQDQSSQRARAIVFVDTRESAIGRTHSPQFEKAVSVAASIGVLLTRYGFSLRLATSHIPPSPVTDELLLETLAGVSHDPSRVLSTGLARLRTAASSDTTLIAITAPPQPNELTSLIRSGSVFGTRIAVLVYPIDPGALPPEPQAQLEGRASAARLSLSRSGWEVVLLSPTDDLRDVWHANRKQLPEFSGSSR